MKENLIVRLNKRAEARRLAELYKRQCDAEIRDRRRIEEIDFMRIRLKSNIFESGVETLLIEIGSVSLVETRKGDLISVRNSNSSGKSFQSVRVGPVRVGSSSGYSSQSITRSKPREDVLKEVDQGKLQLTTREISFFGKKFSRTIAYSHITSFEIGFTHLRVHSRRSKIPLIIKFNRKIENGPLEILLNAVLRFSNGNLDKLNVNDAGSLEDALENCFRSLVVSISLEIDSHKANLQSITREVQLKSHLSPSFSDEWHKTGIDIPEIESKK